MTLSQRTLSTIATSHVLNQNETFPDRTLYTASENAVKIDTTSGVLRVDTSVVPRTSEDMSKLYKWKKGARKLYGTHATKEETGMNQYIKDIESAPNERDYIPVYIDTFKPIAPQFKEKFGK